MFVHLLQKAHRGIRCQMFHCNWSQSKAAVVHKNLIDQIMRCL